MVSAFTKPPIILRKRILQIMTLGLIFVLIGQFIIKSDFLIMTLFLATIVFLCVGYVFYKDKKSGLWYFVASLLISLGENALVIRDRLGHEDIKTTLGTYGHLYTNMNREVADKLNKVFKDIE